MNRKENVKSSYDFSRDLSEIVNNEKISASGRMYVNPKFLQRGAEASGKDNFVQSLNLVTVKPSVYVNPKLFAQITKTNLRTEPSLESHTSVEKLTDKQVENVDVLNETKKTDDRNPVINPNKYAYYSKTKLIKLNMQLESTNLKKAVPKKTVQNVSAAGPFMTLSKTKLVRVRRNSFHGSKNVLSNLSSSSSNSSSKFSGIRRPSFNSTVIRVSKNKLVRVPVKQRRNNEGVVSDSLDTVSSTPLLMLSKTKLVRSPLKERRLSQSKCMLQSSSRAKQFEPKTLVSVTRTKLIRNHVKPRRTRSTDSIVAKQRAITKSSVYPAMSTPRLRRTSLKTPKMTLKAAKSVRSKYKIIRSLGLRGSQSSPSDKATATQQTRYKIDRRLHKTPKCMKISRYNFEKPKLQYSQLKFTNRTWRNSLSPRKIIITDQKLMRIGRSPVGPNKKENIKKQHNACLVQIGGVLYKTSKLKLTRSQASRCKTQDVCQEDSLKKKRMSSSFVVTVRGNKFLMDPTGKKLVKVSQKEKLCKSKNQSPLKRIDIGGVTFIQKSKNVLIRTNTHSARNFLSQAKQKSIAMLTNKLRKSNQPCIFYHRFGKCTKKEKGTCPHIHDPKQVAICRKFLQGCCDEVNCLLSHNVGPEKMPTCKYFLEGCCIRDNCPYLHVKVSEKAGICEKFLQGYCPEAEKCRKRHTFLCPEFDRTGKCSKGKYCPYPHQTVAKKKTKSASKKYLATKEDEPVERKRYYETDESTSVEQKPEESVGENSVVNVQSDLQAKRLKLLKKVNDMKRAWISMQSGTDDHDQSHSNSDLKTEPEMKRPKIGTLPSYIPLT